MAIDVGVNVIYQSDTSKPKAAWDEFIAYTQQHQPTFAAAPQSGAPGSGPATATTFGGLNSVAAPPGSNLGAGFGTPGTQASAATVVAQATVLHQQAQQNSQDLVDRLAQASSAPPNTTAGSGGWSHRSWLAGELGRQSSDLGRASILDEQARASINYRNAFSPGSPGYDAHSRDADNYAARADRYRSGYAGLGDRGIERYGAPQATFYVGPEETGLARTHAGQSGPGSVGGGGRMWVPIGDTPDFQAPGYGAGPRATRAMRANGTEVEDADADDDTDTAIPGDTVARARRYRPAAPLKPKKPTIPPWAKATAAAWAVEHYVSSLIGSDNEYNISMAGATTLPQMLSAQSAKLYSGLTSFPLIGGTLGNLAELGLGWQQHLAGQQAQYGLNLGTQALRRDQANSQGSYQAGLFSQIGQSTGDPAMIRRGIGYQAQVDSNNNYNNFLLDSAPRQMAIAGLDARANSNDDRWWYMGTPRRRGLTPEEQANRDELSRQQSVAGDFHRQQRDMIYGRAAADTFSSQYGEDLGKLGTGYDIEARDRHTAAMAYSGRFQPMTGAAMDEIASDRLSVQQFNMNHPGQDYAELRAQNTASVIAQQRQSFQNLQFQGQAPGTASEVSGMTFFGDFPNVGYRDYQNALAASGGGGADIQGASDQSETAAGNLAQQLAALIDAIPEIIQAIGMVTSWGNMQN